MIKDDLGLSKTDRAKLEKILLDFDEHWNPAALSNAFGNLILEPDEFCRIALFELIKVELHRNWENGDGRKIDSYKSLLESIGVGPEIPAQLILAEFLARHTVGNGPSSKEYKKRFPGQYAEFKKLFEQEKSRRSGLSRLQASINTDDGASAIDTKSENHVDPRSLPETFGRYKILRRLGAGAMGAVYLAHDTQLDRQVALKTPTFGGTKDQELVERFYREARAAANLRNPNICPVFDVGEIDGRHYITMAFIEGRPLSDYVGAKPLDQKAIAGIIRKLAKALADAHAAGVIHRDLKPANIMVDQKRQPLVMDFGLAHREDEMRSRMTQSGTIMGTPAYMSPEQVKGKIDEIGPQADIYSLGIILYELLTGRLPFEGSVAAVIGQILTDQPKSPAEIRRDTDPALQAICLKMIAKELGDRYQSMNEVSRDLADYLKGNESRFESVSPHASAEDPFDFLGIPKLVAESVPILPVLATRVSPRKSVSFRQTKNSRYAKVGAAFFGLILIALSVTLIFRTPYGTLTVTVDDPNLIVEVDGKEINIRDDSPIRFKDGSHELSLRIGDERLPIGSSMPFEIDGRDGTFRLLTTYGETELRGNQFTIDKGSNTALTIKLTPIGSHQPESSKTEPPNIVAPGSGDSSTIAIEPPSDQTDEVAPREPTIVEPSASDPSTFTAEKPPDDQPDDVAPTEPAPPMAIAPFDASEAKSHQSQWAEYLQQPVEFENSIGMKMVLIPPGKFLMGSPSSELGHGGKHNDNEFQHEVAITRPFFLGAYEVTQAQYTKLMGNNPSNFSGSGNGKEQVLGMDTGNFPVENVSWKDTQEFIRRLNGEAGETQSDRHYRLATEAEWEHACRGGMTGPFSFGSSLNGDRANCDGNYPYGTERKGKKLGGTCGVGSYSANGFGLYDMHGNVWEWCEDRYGADYYKTSLSQDPPGPTTGSSRVLRGGSWYCYATHSRSAHRNYTDPSVRSIDVGFRVVCVLENVRIGSGEEPSSPPVMAIDPKDDGVSEMRRISVPPNDEIATAKSDFNEEYSNLKRKADALPPEERLNSIRELAVVVHELHTQETNLATQYVLLETSVLWATESGDPDLTERYISSFESLFEVDGLQYRRDAAVAWAKQIKSVLRGQELLAKRKELLNIIIPLADRAEQEQRFAIAAELLELAAEQSSGDRGQQNELRNRSKSVKAKVDRHEAMLRLAEEVAITTDPDKSLELGKYWCFEVGDWEKGLPYIAAGSDAVLKEAASLDLAGGQTPEARIAIGDTWWGLFGAGTEKFELSSRKRAAFWYESALDQLVGLERKRIEQRLEEIRNIDVPSTPRFAVAPFNASQAKQFQKAWAKHLGVPVEYTNSIGMTFVLIPPGKFNMGKLQGEPIIQQHEVEITTPFFMSTTEVTQKAFELIMDKNPSAVREPDNPVEKVTWQEAVDFCQTLALKEQRQATYRLPTEAEWEYSCRAGTTSDFHFGNDRNSLVDYAWVGSNSDGQPKPVGKKIPNHFGLYDMHGNVWEWCNDWADDYPNNKQTDPTGPPSGRERVARGGEYRVTIQRGESYDRHADEPNSTRKPYVGFRVVCGLENASPGRRLGELGTTLDRDETWTDLLALINPPDHAIEGKWTAQNGEIGIEGASRANRIVIPISAVDNYQLEVEFTRSGTHLGIILPIAGRPCVLWLSRDVCLELWHPQKPIIAVGSGQEDNADGRRHRVEITVERTKDIVVIKAWLNGRQAIDWSGTPDEVGMYSAYDLGAGRNTGLLSQGGSSGVFHRVRYRPLK